LTERRETDLLTGGHLNAINTRQIPNKERRCTARDTQDGSTTSTDTVDVFLFAD
jgi:hypothetical protein